MLQQLDLSSNCLRHDGNRWGDRPVDEVVVIAEGCGDTLMNSTGFCGHESPRKTKRNHTMVQTKHVQTCSNPDVMEPEFSPVGDPPGGLIVIRVCHSDLKWKYTQSPCSTTFTGACISPFCAVVSLTFDHFKQHSIQLCVFTNACLCSFVRSIGAMMQIKQIRWLVVSCYYQFCWLLVGYCH